MKAASGGMERSGNARPLLPARECGRNAIRIASALSHDFPILSDIRTELYFKVEFTLYIFSDFRNLVS